MSKPYVNYQSLSSTALLALWLCDRHYWPVLARLGKKCAVLVGLSILVGCANTGLTGLDADDPASAVVVTATTESAGNAEEEEVDLPNMELDAELLEQLLLANLASYAADWELAANNALLAAQSTRDHRVARLAALLAMRAKNYPAATEGARLWRDLNEHSNDAKTTLLLAQLSEGDVDAAYQGFAEQQAEQSIEEYIKEVGGVLLRQRNGDVAIAIAQRYVTEYPDSAQVALSATYVAENFENSALAEEWLERALALKPDWDLAAQMKANILRRQGKHEERSNYIQQFVANNPSSVGMRINFAAELAREENYLEALELMQAVLEDDPKNVSALTYSAALAQQLKQMELAKDYYKKALRIDPKNDEIRWTLARYAVQEEKYQLAEQYYEQIESQENYFRAQLQIANMRYHTLGLKGAIDTLRALAPRTEAEYVDRATTRHYLLMQENQYEEAFGAINETLAYLPENLDLVYARALVASELHELETAEQDYKFILSQQPNHANALNAFGYTLADQTERFDEARELIEKALELRPEDAHILDSMGWVLFRLQQYDEAIDYLRQAYETMPEAEVAAHLGEVYWVTGETDKAKAIWREAHEKDPDNRLLTKTLERFGIQLQSIAKKTS
ncbi:MAG: tetratricopeptide repeat protein [Pseudomonadota bacterium]